MFRTEITRPIMIVLLIVAFWGGALASAEAAGVRPAAAAPAGLSGTKSVCPAGGDYPTLTAALAASASDGLDGPLTLELCAGYTSASETFPLTFTAFPGSSATNTVTVRPAADAVGLSITGAAASTVFLDGATYVIFDGRPGGVGSSQELTIGNIAADGSAVRLENGAAHNLLQYLILQGVNNSAASAPDGVVTGGVVHFAGATGATGNNANTLDHCELRAGATLPANLVYAAGSAGAANSGNVLSNNRFHDFFSENNSSAGVYLAAANTGWTITGNSFYQPASRHISYAGYTHYGIYIGDGDGYTVNANSIGGSQPDGGGAAWTYYVGSRFRGLQLAVGAATASSVQGNTIANWVISSNSNTDGWSGIYVQSGAVNIGTVTGNTIGSGTGTGAIQATTSSVSNPVSYGIYASSAADVTIANNTIGAVTVAGTTWNLHSFVGITTAGTGNVTITGNLVGSLTTADSIQVSGHLDGIESSSGGMVAITGNTVANLRNTHSSGNYGGTGSTAGIRTRSGANTITGNTVRNLTATNNTQALDHNAMLIGIVQTSTTAGDQIVAQNVVHSLSCQLQDIDNYHYLYCYGIYFDAPLTATNLVSRNFVHSLAMVVNSAMQVGELIGIYGRGTGTYQNNVVRLGLDAQGAAVNQGKSTYGIRQAAAASFYFNTVYIGGASVQPLETTYAFYGSGDPLTLQNNLLFNARANSGGGSKLHYAAYFPAATAVTSDYNVYLACNEPWTPIGEGATDRTLAAWQTASGQDSHSGSPSALAQVNFVNATGDAASLDLRVQSPTVVEAAGMPIPAVTDDYAGQARAGLTPVDIGAYAGDWSRVSPPPAIHYTALPATPELTGPTLSDVVIDAAAGVASAPGTRPRLYFKRSFDADTFNDNTAASDGWKWVEANGSGGSPFDFTLDYSLLYGGSGASVGDTIQYFVIAQTLAVPPGVGIADGVLGGAVAPASVALAADAFPLAGTVNSYRILGLGGVRTVCATGCDFTSLTLADGLFAKINSVGLYSDLVAEIRGDLTAETGATALNQWTDVLGGPWTLTIRPAGGAARRISGSATTLIDLNGADRVIIDGLNSDGNSLRIGPSGGGRAIHFHNDASDNIVRNCTLEGAASALKASDLSTVILISLGITTGNDNNTIANNIIQWNGAAYLTQNLIMSAGSFGFANSGNTIANNTLRNFGKTVNPSVAYGINIALGGNENWTISGNTIYQDNPRGSTLYGIYLNSEGVNTISGNTIRDMNAGPPVYGIYLGNGGATTVSRNRITLTTGVFGSAWYGIYYRGGSHTTTVVTLTNNAITVNPSTSFSQALYGIYDNGYAGSALTAYHNSVYIGGTATGSATWAFLRGASSADTVVLKNNLFFNNRTGGAVDHFAAGNQSASGTFTADYNLFAGTGVAATSFMDWGTSSSGTPMDFAAWQANSGGDSHSYADVAANIPVASLFTDAANGDLSIVTGSGFDAAPLPSNRGVGGLGVTEDFNGAQRSATRPDLGAFEFTVDRTGLAGPGTLAGGWGYYDTLDIASGAITMGSTVYGVNLRLAAGATATLQAGNALAMAGVVTNAGTLAQTQAVPGGEVIFMQIGDGGAHTAYWGVALAPEGDLGAGTAQVSGEQAACPHDATQAARRCYDLAATGGVSTTVKFYLTAGELRGGQTLASLQPWRWDGSAWQQLSKGAVGSDNGDANCTSGEIACYVSAVGVDAFGAFKLENAASNTLTPSGSGNWSEVFPACSGVCNYQIPAGFTVTLDQDVTLAGNLDVQGTLAPNGKTVTLTGDKAQTLSGNLTFHNLTINKTNATDTVTVTAGKLTSSGRTRIRKGKLITASDYEDLEIEEFGTLKLGNNITIGGNLVVTGTLDTNGYGVTFDGAKAQNLTLVHVTTFDDLTVAAGTTLIETESGDHAVVNGTLTNNGVIRKTQMIDAETDYYFGLASQGELTIDVTTDNFTSITVARRDQNHAGRTGAAPPAAGVGWGIYWTITPDGSGEVNLTLPHALADDTKAQACRFVSGTTWDCARDASDEWTVTRNGVTTFSDWAVGNGVSPTAVTLNFFMARMAGAGVALDWQTASEVGVVGFDVYRAASAAGPYTRVNAALIPAQGDALMGAAYRYVDTPGFGGFYYQLEDVAADGGRTRHGPVGVQVMAVQRVYVPLVLR
jgi:hypothetical protein